jgi:MFS family permease
LGKELRVFLPFRNPVFCLLWLASVLSVTFVSAQDIIATWLMHDLGASAFALSFMATAAAAPFFVFTLPAGAVADIVNRRTVIVSAVLWQGACSALLALGAWTRVLNPISVLVCIFALGVGFAFAAPVMGAMVPDVVDREELPSAITLGGVQMNLAGIVGPALGGFLLPLLGAPLLITINALTFLVVAFAVLQWSSVRTPVPQGANLAECDHLDLYDDNGRGAACDVSHASSARFDDVRNTCWRGLDAGGIRALGGWTARDARMGAWTNEFVSDHVRTRRHRDRGIDLGLGSGKFRS